MKTTFQKSVWHGWWKGGEGSIGANYAALSFVVEVCKGLTLVRAPSQPGCHAVPSVPVGRVSLWATVQEHRVMLVTHLNATNGTKGHFEVF